MADSDEMPPADQQQEVVPTADTNGVVPEVTSDTNGNSEPTPSTEKRKPIASWRVKSDGTTSIELAVWANMVRAGNGDEYEQLSFTVTRSYKTNGEWTRQEKPSWRTHDVPVLLFLMQKAHAFALERRTTADIPF